MSSLACMECAASLVCKHGPAHGRMVMHIVPEVCPYCDKIRVHFMTFGRSAPHSEPYDTAVFDVDPHDDEDRPAIVSFMRCKQYNVEFMPHGPGDFKNTRLVNGIPIPPSIRAMPCNHCSQDLRAARDKALQERTDEMQQDESRWLDD